MSASVETVSTSIAPDFFVKRTARSKSRALVVFALALIVLVGFSFRATQLGAEGLSEDELNKLRAVEDYRAHGLTAANGEHPMLMKALLTLSIVGAERWNSSAFAAEHPSWAISTEAALRLPATIFGALTSLLIFLVATELFGMEVGFIAAALWSLDPSAIGFNRIAKEDSFLLFFFLLANVFWLRGQRVAESMRGNPLPYYWATAAAFGAMMASKYLPHLIGISIGYYYIFQGIPQTRWRMGKRRFLLFFAIMGVVFLMCNPAILLPGTWHEMKVFAGEHRIGHDSYEFMGKLYHNQMTMWLRGVPWYFYYVFMLVKIPLPVVAAFVVGLPLLFRKRLGDGRFFVLFWLLFWFMPFSVLGGKFTRYFTMALPVVLITSAIGIQFIAQAVANFVGKLFEHETVRSYVRAAVAVFALGFPALASAGAGPHFRLYTNSLGGGVLRAGSYFPHDEFYDASVRETVGEIVRRAPQGARVASETPTLVAYYAQLAGRSDLVSISLSDREAVRKLGTGDFVIVARGRRYFSNETLVNKLQEASRPVATVMLGEVTSANLYKLDEVSAGAASEALK
ncbi:MAG: glycosyltransferase family 39 protein [Pyrinomonadaceae bacterium]